MASTSASSILKSFKYDVFLSFRGEDTRKSFVDNLYHALKQNGIYTYKDDQEIKKGERISDELIKSIEDSKFYIIVFFKNYASSSWCLDELVKIMECQRTTSHTAYPIFYDVEPTEVRNQTGVVGEAIDKHVNEKVVEWRDALKEAASLAGWELKNNFDGHEAQFIQKIVEEISQELRFINSSIDEKLIGMETRVKDVVSSLETNIYDFRMIGIKGMGGAGKTTLARVVFDQISFRFEGSSFVENVRENSKNPSCGLKSLQKQVLSDVLKAKDITVNGVYEGKKMMKQRMCCIKVLVVLDDVDHIDQLEALVGELSWFKPGSRVIITTREEQVLVAHGVPKNMILDVNLLSYEEAIRLFNRYAFGKEVPKKIYKELSRQVVRYAAGLPLTIKVLGSFLRGKDELEYWTDALERLKTIPLKETQEILEISYNGLEEDYKEIFLDVACILKGWKKTKAIIALESCGLHGTSGLRVLEQKSLITIIDNGILGMHDHIEEMGKNIVRRSYPNLPYRHSRLWIGEEIKCVLVKDRGAEATRCIILKSLDPKLIMKGLRNMNELIFLVVTGGSTIPDLFNNNMLRVNCYNLADNDVEEDGIDLPDSLRYICWNNYPYTCLPNNFIGNNLVVLEMHSSKLRQLWKDAVKKVPKLKFIALTNCDLRTFDVGLTKNLERLQLNHCSNLVELRMPIGSYKLKSLSIACCKLIITLDLVWAQNLETLEVKECDDLVELCMPIESFKLKSLSISIACCRLISTLDLVRAKNLETIEVRECDDLVELRMPIESFKLKSICIAFCKLISTLDLGQAQNLETLEVSACHDLVKFHMPIESFKLKSISIAFCKLIRTLDLVRVHNLETLEVRKCDDLVELRMPIECFKLKSFSIACYKLISTLDLSRAHNLKTLKVRECDDLVELRMPFESFKLKSLSIDCCKLISTLDLVRAQNLETLEVRECDNLVELHMLVENPKLKDLHLQDCCKLKTLNLTRTWNLKKLLLFECGDLLELCMPIESHDLKTISIGCSKLRTLYLGLSPYLEHLYLHNCYNLVEIHARVGCLSGSVMLKPCLVSQGFPSDGPLAELHIFARSLGICPLHPDNNLPKFHFECIYKDLLLSSAENLAKLISFSPCACANLASLSGIICGVQLRKLTLEGSIPEVPKELDQLKCLEELSLLSTKIEHFPDSICMLKHLKFLRLKSCWFLKKLPEDIGRLELSILNGLYILTRYSKQHL